MTEITPDSQQDQIPGAESAVTPPEPKKRATKRPAKKAAAPEPDKPARDAGSYLPALPEGYAYTKVEITGPDGTAVTVGCSPEGNYAVDVSANGLDRSTPYPTFAAAVRGAAERAKLLHKRAARQAELAALDAEFDA